MSQCRKLRIAASWLEAIDKHRLTSTCVLIVACFHGDLNHRGWSWRTNGIRLNLIGDLFTALTNDNGISPVKSLTPTSTCHVAVSSICCWPELKMISDEALDFSVAKNVWIDLNLSETPYGGAYFCEMIQRWSDRWFHGRCDSLGPLLGDPKWRSGCGLSFL